MGEMYTTRQRWASVGTGENMMRWMHHKNAARVLPLPVGARIKVDSPRAIAGQPAICGRVGAGKTAANQSRTAGWKMSRALTDGDALSEASFCCLGTDVGSSPFLR